MGGIGSGEKEFLRVYSTEKITTGTEDIEEIIIKKTVYGNAEYPYRKDYRLRH